MRTRHKRLLSIGFGLTVGVLLAAGLTAVYRLTRPAPRKLAAEDHAAVRARLDDDPKAIYMFDEDVSYRLKPNHRGVRYYSDKLPHQTNSLGLLGADEVNADPRVRKWLFLGDSVTYGNGVPLESSFVARMQRLASGEFQLLNAACPGWSTHQELRHYETHLATLPCELLIVMFCLNDLAKYEWVYDSENEPKLSGEVPQWGAGTAQALRICMKRRSFDADPTLAPLAKQHNGFLLAWDEQAWNDFWPAIVEPFLSRHKQTPVVFVALPAAKQVEACRLGAPREVVFFPQRMLQRRTIASGASLIDAADALLGSTATDEPLFMDDCHLTVRGHELTAQYLWPRLSESSVANSVMARTAPRDRPALK